MADRPTNLISAILPKTLAGLAAYLVVFAAGMAVSGVALFAFYQWRVSSLEAELLDFGERFNETFLERTQEFEELVEESRGAIEQAARGVGSKTHEMTELLEKVGPSIARVEGLDLEEQPTSGSAFVVTSQNNESWLITSFSVVAGSVAREENVKVTIGNATRDTIVWSWDQDRDLALIILRTGSLPALGWAEGSPDLGSRVWGVGAAPGRFGAAASDGNLLDVSEVGLLADVDVPLHNRGGPLLDKDGMVLGVMSLSYAPEGFSPSNGWIVPIRFACQKVLRCPD